MATGPAGNYGYPFGTTGTIFFLVNFDNPGGGYGTFFTANDNWILVGSVSGTDATIADGADRTYTSTFTLTSDMVASIPDGTEIVVVAMGFDPALGTLLLSDPQTVTINVVDGA